MRITCECFHDFLENLKGAEKISDRGLVVHFSKSYRSLTNDPVATSHSVEVSVSLSCVIPYLYTDGEALLETQFVTGTWRKTADGNKDGEVAAENVRRAIKEFCAKQSHVLLPGILDA